MTRIVCLNPLRTAEAAVAIKVSTLMLCAATLVILGGCMSPSNGTSMVSWSQTAARADQAQEWSSPSPAGSNLAL